MTIDVYIMTYNEELILPHLLQWYSFARKIYLLDGYSNDKTYKIAKEYTNVEIVQINSNGEIRDDIHIGLKNNVWKGNDADWVIVIDADEFVWSKNLYERLEYCKENNYDVIKTVGYNMFSREYPKDFTKVLDGVYDLYSCKPCIFNPRIKDINLTVGGHSAANNLKTYFNDDIRLLHFKYIGYKEQLNRLAVNRARKSKSDLDSGYGLHHNWDNLTFLNKMIEIDLSVNNIFYEYPISNNSIKYSIVVSTHENIDKLELAIESVLRQTYENWELLIASDMKEPEKIKMLDKYRDKRIKYFEVGIPKAVKDNSIKNYGIAQKNAMTEQATGDYILYLDDDNILFSDCLENYNTYLVTDADLLISKVIHQVGLIPKTEHIIVNEIDTLNFIVKTETAKQCKWNYGIYANDYDFLKQIQLVIKLERLKIMYCKFIAGVHK